MDNPYLIALFVISATGLTIIVSGFAIYVVINIFKGLQDD